MAAAAAVTPLASADTKVMVDARNFWGTTYRNICVHYGENNMGWVSYWVILDAWYNGRLF